MRASLQISRLTITAAISSALITHAQAQTVDCRVDINGLSIVAIDIQIDPVFDESKPQEAHALNRLANRLHVDTKDSAIRERLLFEVGQAFEQRLLDESLRALRSTRFLFEPTVETDCVLLNTSRLAVQVSSNEAAPAQAIGVKVLVRARETWTLTPTLSFGRSGGRSKNAIGIEDNNFLGTGKLLELVRKDDRNRTTNLLRYQDNNLFGGRQTLETRVFSSSDGDGGLLRLELPFYALDTKRQWLALYDNSELLQTRTIFEQEVDRYQANYRHAELSLGFSEGLQANSWVHRTTTGLRMERASFKPTLQSTSMFAYRASRELSLPLPGNRKFVYPFLRFEGLQNDFATTKDQDQIGRTEDQKFGWSYSAELGQASRSFESNKTQTLMRASVANGIRFDQSQLFSEAHVQGRFGKDSDNQLMGGSLRYYTPIGERSKFFAGLQLDYGRDLDADRPLVLGGENGLRGYPFDYQYGSKRSLLTLEQRYYTDYKPFQLVQVGAAAFVDIGHVSGASPLPAEQLGTLANVGFGLRLGSLRSARANQLHIDFAYPLNGRKEDRGLQVVIETKASF
jgi:outer membrane protein assembly factor BamA